MKSLLALFLFVAGVALTSTGCATKAAFATSSDSVGCVAPSPTALIAENAAGWTLDLPRDNP